MTHGRFSLTLLLALILSSSGYALAQSPEPAAPPSPGPQAPATLKGEGTAGRIPKFKDKYLLGNSVITENDKGLLGINNTNPSALLHIYEAPQPSTVIDGTAAPNLIHTTGGKGGATTSGGGWTAGRGAGIVLTAGNGGDAPAGSTTGDGGSIFLRPGVPGSGGFQGKFGRVVIADQWGAVGIGTSTPNTAAKVNIKHTVTFGTGLLVQAEGQGISAFGTNGNGVSGYSVYGSAIYGTTGSSSAFAGKFIGPVQVTGTLTVNGNVCASNHPCSSDARLKVGIAGLNYGLRHLLQLRPVTWKWKEESTGPLQFGLVAQEVEPVMPALVMRDAGDASKPLGLNYMGLLPVVVKAVQEQQAELESRDARIAELRAQVEQLERENEAFKARLEALERAVMKSADGSKQ